MSRFNFLGGAGSGKSTTSAWIYSELKQRNISVELVREYVKNWAYQNRKINDFDQVYITGKQLNAEYLLLSNGVKNTVTDCPVLLGAIYSDIYAPDLGLC